MQNEYKAGLYRFSLITSASLSGLLSTLADNPMATVILLLATAWLLLTTLLLDVTPRWPLPLPWHCIPSFLLATLIWLDPSRYAVWSWSWALLLILPQPRWTSILHVILAIFGWWQFHDLLAPPVWALYGLLLSLLLLIGQSNALQLRSLWQNAAQCDQLITGQRLWAADGLIDDLAREHARSDREGTHAELLLLRTERRQQRQAANALWNHLAAFEHCYRIDHHTLAALLIGKDLSHARQRRELLVKELPESSRVRVVNLAQPLSLTDEYQALEKQQTPNYCIEEAQRHG
ncbi:hypothetical protein [Aidingimonas lacisalsi]|uniref:hypothetical protein n=1 Tax=Aidingimonas lacisalsi TaxID=2604086 RepID=UPI0011D1A4F8|nr:hypothetical protein [Aidingimonas lacisalsi]